MNDLLSDTTGTVSMKIKKRFGTSEVDLGMRSLLPYL